ncbi:hypothetical protein DSO57_1010208 [Entomophthora muscae]|uniref:Uncharacterized protein n=1 Tax=Entomophthora muscae TaxID=34485 RepID=A0ACC2RLD3_9FUNG|nr:hypothetical protein DSO57_1010208 [Entomophthora muscae]
MPPRPQSPKSLTQGQKGQYNPKKQSSKAKALPKTPTPSPEQEGNSPTPLHSPFVYSPSDPQEKLFNFNCHSDPTSEPEDEEEQKPEPGAPAYEPIELWDLNFIHNVCNQIAPLLCQQHTAAKYAAWVLISTNS